MTNRHYNISETKTDKSRHMLAATVGNKCAVMSRVTGLFSERNLYYQKSCRCGCQSQQGFGVKKNDPAHSRLLWKISATL